MKIRRDIASVPARSARETWDVIVNLVTGDETVDGGQFEAARSVMECLIADEQPANVPIVFKGGGPRVLIYCQYNEDAMDAGLEIESLNDIPTAGDWRMTAPCEREDKEWMNNSLKQRAPRVSVHAVDEVLVEEEEKAASGSLKVDWSAVMQS